MFITVVYESLLLFLIFHFIQILQSLDNLDTKHEHLLTLLAEETKNLLKKDTTLFMPILSQRHPQATAVSSSLLHRLYGIKLVSNAVVFLKQVAFYIFLYTLLFLGGSDES